MTITTPIYGVICRPFGNIKYSLHVQEIWSYTWGMVRAFKFKVDHVTWPRFFQRQFVVRRLGLAIISLHTKFEMSTITCNEDMKGSAKICRNSLFEPPFGGLRGDTQGSSMARCKAHYRLPAGQIYIGWHWCNFVVSIYARVLVAMFVI